ncbi:MAG: hypothetical protein RJA99_2288 [Pseudomonadota bacterium]|jgi:two-component system cell cycle sensor histidine kinase/response regulator CckA
MSDTVRARVLVVEDDRMVAWIVEQVLQGIGCEVEHASDGLEAIERLHADASRFALAIVDLVLPRADGATVLAAVRRLRPSLPVLMTSGHDEAYVRGRIGDVPIAGFVPKPWQPETLEAAVRSAIGQALT